MTTLYIGTVCTKSFESKSFVTFYRTGEELKRKRHRTLLRVDKTIYEWPLRKKLFCQI